MADIELELEAADLGALFAAEEGAKDGTEVYEVGYHLLPTLSEAEVTAATKDIASFLTKEGAVFVGDHAPERIDLAYDISKRINGRITPFKEAYFGWMAFELARANAVKVKAFLDAHAHILRYLFVATSKDEVKAVMEGAVLIPTASASTEAIAAPKRTEEQGAAVSDEALSQALDTMAEEDASAKTE